MRAKTTLIMPDLELWALAQSTDVKGEVSGVTTSVLWDLVQSTISDMYAAPNAGEGGLYVVGSLNLPRRAIPEPVKHFFSCAGAVIDVQPDLDKNSINKCIERASEDIIDLDVNVAFAEARAHLASRIQASRQDARLDVGASPTKIDPLDDEAAREAACEALRVRVRRARSIVRAAIAKCTKELLKTRKFDRFFDDSDQASKLIQLALDRKIGDPKRFIRDLRACAKAMKPRKNTPRSLHKPVVSLGFNATDTLESWFHLGVTKLYDEYVAHDKEYDVALSASVKFTNFLPGVPFHSKAPSIKEEGHTIAAVVIDENMSTTSAQISTPADAAAPRRRVRADAVAECAAILKSALLHSSEHKSSTPSSKVIQNLHALRDMIDNERCAQQQRERDRVLQSSSQQL
jgi:hypothetical protein